MDKKIIIFDIDGTLYDNKNKCLYESSIECIKTLYEKGHELVIASGRSFPMISNIDKIKKYINTYILINGQIILRNGIEIYKEAIELNKLKKLLEDFNEYDIPYGCISSSLERLSKINEDVNHAYTSFCLKEPVVDEDYYLKDDIYQIWCFGDNDKIKDFIIQHPDYDFMPWGGTGYDVVPKGRNKARTIKKLIEILGYEMKDVIALGDGYNDISMINTVGFGIAMGNACDELKEVADYITDDIDKDGVYKVFKYLNMI